MTDAAVAATIKNGGTRSAPVSQRVIVLVLGLGLLLGCRLLLDALMPPPTGDFDLLYEAAARLLRGQNPYPIATPGIPYPLPAVLLAIPFTTIPLELARPVFDILAGWAFACALWRYRGEYALLALGSGTYLFALWHGQTIPLLVAASIVPALGSLLAVRPTTGAALWTARPSWIALIGVGLFFYLSLMIRPWWHHEWWMGWPADSTDWLPPILRPFGFVLLLAAIRWRLPEARLLFAMALMPQTALPYELVLLALIPANRLEMEIYLAGSWIAVAATTGALHLSHGNAEWTLTGWTVTLCATYFPMLYLVLRPRTRAPQVVKERRRANRLPDDELDVDVTTDGAGGVVVTVTHLPSQLSATESGPTKEQVKRKAHDKLASILTRSLRAARKMTEPNEGSRRK
jgi:hypothetical protein